MYWTDLLSSIMDLAWLSRKYFENSNTISHRIFKYFSYVLAMLYCRSKVLLFNVDDFKPYSDSRIHELKYKQNISKQNVFITFLILTSANKAVPTSLFYYVNSIIFHYTRWFFYQLTFYFILSLFQNSFMCFWKKSVCIISSKKKSFLKNIFFNFFFYFFKWKKLIFNIISKKIIFLGVFWY